MNSSQRKVLINEVYEVQGDTASGPIRFRTRVHAVDASSIGLAEPEAMRGRLKARMPLTILYFRDGKAFRFATRVTELRPAPTGRQIHIELPAKVEQFERRRQPRKTLKGSARIQPEISKLPTLDGQLQNGSTGGISVSAMAKPGFTHRDRVIGLKCSVTLKLPGASYENLSMVVRGVHKPSRLEGIVIVHLQFSAVPAADRDRLARLLS